MTMAITIGQRSLCDRDKVGAVIVDRNNRIVDTGYNGPPRGFITDDKSCLAWCSRAVPYVDETVPVRSKLNPHYDDCPSLHAEANALMFSDRRLREGGTIYVSSGVCMGCAKLIANSGLETVVSRMFPQHEHRRSNDSYAFMEKCGLTVIVHHVGVSA